MRKARMGKGKPSVFVLVFLLFLPLGCGKTSSPSQVVTEFYMRLGRGDYEGASRYLSAEAKLLLGFAMGMAEMLQEYAQEIWGRVSITRVEILGEWIQGNQAQVTYRIHLSDGTRSEVDRAALVQEDGQWKIGLEF